tara:strand:- start:214 stop:858 length:645 start_codon:yes stop_codon:yes gene_type:complete
MADRLSLYNDALMYAGERSLASLTEDREPRRLLDQVWASQGVDRCLEEAQWHFAMRADRFDYDPSVTIDFGYGYAFTKPDDWIITSAVCEDEYFRVPLNQYTDEKGYWYADIDPLYVRYVSNDVDFGMDLGKWPATFADFVAVHFASRIITKLSASGERLKELMTMRKMFLVTAKNKAAMAQPTSFAAKGSWSRARTRGARRGDGGNQTGNLTG